MQTNNIFVPYILLDILFNHAMPMATGGIKIDKGLCTQIVCVYEISRLNSLNKTL
jgi:hypothetical protein